MRRWVILLVSLASAGAFTALSPADAVIKAQESPRPNVLLLVSDDQSWSTFNAAIAPRVFGDLVDQGMLFTRAYVQTPICCPSRSQILTGLSEQHTGVDDNTHPLKRLTIVEALHDAGYRTGIAGKYINGQPCDPLPEFDQWVCQEQGFGGIYHNPILNINGTEVQASGYSTDLLASEAADFIASTPAGQPFFAMYTPISPHLPANDARCFDLSVTPFRPASFDEDTQLSGKPVFVQRGPLTQSEISDIDLEFERMTQAVKCLDPGMGTVLDALGDRSNDTLVVYLSDNGFLYGEHRRMTKGDPYDESVRTPFIVRYPAMVPAGTTTDALVENVDIAPTIAELAGIEWHSDGVSMVPILDGSSGSVRDTGLFGRCQSIGFPCWETFGQDQVDPPSFSGVVDSQYKYTEYLGGDMELYDLSTDPNELVNLAGNPAFAGVQALMANELAALTAPPPTDTTIVSGPSGTVGSGTYRFDYFSQSRFASFRCRLDLEGVEGIWTACPSQSSIVGPLTPGSYVFNVEGTDENGVADPSPATRSFQVEDGAPGIQVLNAPATHGQADDVTFTYTSDVGGVTFECRLSRWVRTAPWQGCSSAGSIYSSLADGIWEFQVRAVDPNGGIVTDPPAQWTFWVDNTGPEINFRHVPASPTNVTTDQFLFVASEETSGPIQCQLDGHAVTDCSNGSFRLARVVAGTHVARFNLSDTVGNATMLAYTWIVDLKGPGFKLTADVGAYTTSSTATMTLASQGWALYSCSLDGAPAKVCASPAILQGLGQGPHAFVAYARDKAGNASVTRSISWTVDSVAPIASIVSGPENPTTLRKATFELSANESVVRLSCSLDGGAPFACESTVSLKNLATGGHVFNVRATDPAGNVGPDASWTWTIV